jgi:dTDP-4-amino-4,6-dideoxygalactose transaminase
MNAALQPVKRSVPLLDLKPQYLAIKADIDAAIGRVCASQMFVLGPEVKEFERAIAQYSGAKFGIGLSSGTDALLIALMAFDIGYGDEVITSSYTFFATGGTVARTGARPIYVDIDPKTYNISPAAVEKFIADECESRGGRLINRKTGGVVRALIPVHLYGQMADMDPLMQIARRYQLRVIEDAAQAIGSEYPHNRRAGSLGDIGCFSFFPTKNLGGFGDSGLCTANDPQIAETLEILRVHGGKPKYYHSVIGGNFRLDEIQAAVLNVKLKHLDAWTAGRQRNAAYYDRAFAAAKLEGQVTTPVALPGYRHIYNQYCIRVPQRDRLRAYLTECGIGTEIYYPVPLHLQKCFEYLGYRAGDLPESEKAANETLALPIYPELTSEQLQHVVDSIERFVHGSA